MLLPHPIPSAFSFAGILALREDINAACASARHFEAAWETVHGTPEVVSFASFAARRVDELADRLQRTNV